MRSVFLESSRFLVIAVRTMLAAAFTAMAALQMVFFGKHDVALRTQVKILGIELAPS